MKKVLAVVLMGLACVAAYAETDYTVERKVDYLWRHVMGGGGGGGDYPTKEWVNGKIGEEAQARADGDSGLSTQVTAVAGSVSNVSDRVTALEGDLGDYVTYDALKNMITDGGIVIGNYEYQLVVETVRNLSDSVLRFADGSVVVTNVTGTFPATYAGNTNLVSAELGRGVTGLAEGALQGCTGLTNLVLSDSFTTLGRVCCNNTRISTLSVPSGVTVFPIGCFGNSQNLKTAYVHGYITAFNMGAFATVDAVITDITFTAMTKAQVRATSGWDYAFYQAHGLAVHCTDGDFYVP